MLIKKLKKNLYLLGLKLSLLSQFFFIYGNYYCIRIYSWLCAQKTKYILKIYNVILSCFINQPIIIGNFNIQDLEVLFSKHSLE